MHAHVVLGSQWGQCMLSTSKPPHVLGCTTQLLVRDVYCCAPVAHARLLILKRQEVLLDQAAGLAVEHINEGGQATLQDIKLQVALKLLLHVCAAKGITGGLHKAARGA